MQVWIMQVWIMQVYRVMQIRVMQGISSDLEPHCEAPVGLIQS